VPIGNNSGLVHGLLRCSIDGALLTKDATMNLDEYGVLKVGTAMLDVNLIKEGFGKYFKKVKIMQEIER
jgi:hypothetical protein